MGTSMADEFQRLQMVSHTHYLRQEKENLPVKLYKLPDQVLEVVDGNHHENMPI